MTAEPKAVAIIRAALDEPTVGAPPAAPEPKPAEAKRESFPMQPMGEPNRWLYRGEIVTYHAHRKPAGMGRWATVEGIGNPIIHSDERADVCRGIDARLAAAVGSVDCGECPLISTGCAGKCMKAPACDATGHAPMPKNDPSEMAAFVDFCTDLFQRIPADEPATP